MFYAHEFLTSRKYGIATVWLVATLGQSSVLKKVGKKAILEVDVEKACDLIISPDAPMALRLQSSLLYGLSRIFAQQCGYVLSDTQSTYNFIRNDTTSIFSPNINSRTKANPQDLILGDGGMLSSDILLPSLDEFLLNFDSPSKAIETQPSVDSHVSLSSDASKHDKTVIEPPESLHMNSVLNEAPLVEADDFEFDEDGNIIDLANAHIGTVLQSGQDLSDVLIHNDNSFRDYNPPPLNDDDYHYGISSNSLSTAKTLSDSYTVSNEFVETLQIPLQELRKSRQRKVLLPDKEIQIPIPRDAMNYGTYVRTMQKEIQALFNRRILHQAKSTANHSILGRGLNRIGNLFHPNIDNPLNIFTGQSLHDWVFRGHCTEEALVNDKKRKLDVSGSQILERNVRQRSHDVVQTEIGRCIEDDDMEVFRQAEDDLQDVSSVMPWSASNRSSSVSKLHRNSGNRLRSRLVSASPTLRRGLSLQPIDDQGYIDIEDDLILATPYDDTSSSAIIQIKQNFEVTLDEQSQDFLNFIYKGIESKQADQDQLASQLDTMVVTTNWVAFEELLPCSTTTRRAAANGLLYTLSLGTKNFIQVEQTQPYSAIMLTI